MMHLLILCKCVSVKFLSSLEGNGAQISVWAASDPLIYQEKWTNTCSCSVPHWSFDWCQFAINPCTCESRLAVVIMVMVSQNKNGSLVVIVQVENTTVFGPWQVLTKLFNDRKSHDSQGHQRNVSISCLQQAKIKIFHDNSASLLSKDKENGFMAGIYDQVLTYHKKLPILLSFSPFFLKSNFSLRTQIDLGTKRLFSMFFVSIEWLFSYSIWGHYCMRWFNHGYWKAKKW